MKGKWRIGGILLIVLLLLPFLRSIDIIPTNTLYAVLASVCVLAIRVNRHEQLRTEQEQEDSFE